jgi:hypothetical protein
MIYFILTAQIVCNIEKSFLKIGCFSYFLEVTLFLQNWDDFNLQTGTEERISAFMH